MTTHQDRLINAIAARGTDMNLIVPEPAGTYAIPDPWSATTTVYHLTREAILDGLSDWAEQTLIWREDLPDEVANIWPAAARAAQSKQWECEHLLTTITDDEIVDYVLRAATEYL